MAPAANTRLPVYFLGIGGPNTIENPNHPAAARLAAVGKEITSKIKPKAIVVFSAHWQDGPSTVKVNVAESANIIHDFEGFPASYYEVQYPNRGSPEIAQQVIEKLRTAGVNVEGVERGLDHGVWVGFLCAFDPETNPLNVPIVQVSLYDNEDADLHYRLGQAVSSMRDENILIIGAGMGVHNTAGYRATKASGENLPYTISFEKHLTDAVTGDAAARREKLAGLLARDDIRDAHPTFEHILPVHISAGAAGLDKATRLWEMPEGGINWVEYRFGDVPAAA